MVVSPTNFTNFNNWSQGATGYVSWSSGTANYARTNTLITTADWQIDVKWDTIPTAGYGCAGLSLTTTPDDKEFFNACFVYDATTDPDNVTYYAAYDGGHTQATQAVDVTKTYQIKCISGQIAFYIDDVLWHNPGSNYIFDPTWNTSAYVATGQAISAQTIYVQDDVGSSPTSSGTRLPPPPIVLGGL